MTPTSRYLFAIGALASGDATMLLAGPSAGAVVFVAMLAAIIVGGLALGTGRQP
jgi:hypothetical protein